MSCNDEQRYSPAERSELLALARQSIEHGLRHGVALRPALERCSAALREPRASFVTLTLHEQLRGCIGSLEARQPLALDVSVNAFNAAFHDPRFAPLRSDELPLLAIAISVLSPPQAMHFSSERDLLAQLRPGVDGLILSEGRRRGTFLPSVWESLPDATEFLRHLKLKAGLAPDHWSTTLQVERYTAEYIS